MQNYTVGKNYFLRYACSVCENSYHRLRRSCQCAQIACRAQKHLEDSNVVDSAAGTRLIYLREWYAHRIRFQNGGVVPTSKGVCQTVDIRKARHVDLDHQDSYYKSMSPHRCSHRPVAQLHPYYLQQPVYLLVLYSYC